MGIIVGITAYAESARWGGWERRTVLLPERYVTQVAAAGARAVLVPPSTAGAAELVTRLDALLLAGGSDIDPARYDAAVNPRTTGVRPDRDAGELALLDAALAADLPVLGICRGMQLLVIAHGGGLHQHLPDVVGHDGHRDGLGTYARHAVRLAPDSLVGRTLGPAVEVDSYHHQGIASSGSLTATGWAEDGTVEAVEAVGRRFTLGVLWHPEVGADPRLFRALVAAASGVDVGSIDGPPAPTDREG